MSEFSYNNQTPIDSVLDNNLRIKKLLGVDNEGKPRYLDPAAFLRIMPDVDSRIVGFINDDLAANGNVRNKATSSHGVKLYIDTTAYERITGNSSSTWNNASPTIWGLRNDIIGEDGDDWDTHKSLWSLKSYVEDGVIGEPTDRAFDQSTTLYGLNRQLVVSLQNAIYGTNNYDSTHPTTINITNGFNDRPFLPTNPTLISTKMGSFAHIFNCTSSGASNASKIPGLDSGKLYQVAAALDGIQNNNYSGGVAVSPTRGSNYYESTSGIQIPISIMKDNSGWIFDVPITVGNGYGSATTTLIAIFLVVQPTGVITNAGAYNNQHLVFGTGDGRVKLIGLYTKSGLDYPDQLYELLRGNQSTFWSNSNPTVWGLKNYVDQEISDAISDITDPTNPNNYTNVEMGIYQYSGSTPSSPKSLSNTDIPNLLSHLYSDGGTLKLIQQTPQSGTWIGKRAASVSGLSIGSLIKEHYEIGSTVDLYILSRITSVQSSGFIGSIHIGNYIGTHLPI